MTGFRQLYITRALAANGAQFAGLDTYNEHVVAYYRHLAGLR